MRPGEGIDTSREPTMKGGAHFHTGDMRWYSMMISSRALNEMLSIDRKASDEPYIFPGNQEIFYIRTVGTVSDASIDPPNLANIIIIENKRCSGAKR